MSLPHLVQHLQSIPILRAQHQHLLFAHPDILPVLNRNFLLCWNRNFSFCCDNLPHVGAFRMDWNVLLFALFLSVLTGVVFGLIPALTASRADLSESLKEASLRGGSGGH